MHIQKYEDWQSIRESEELNEIFGLGELFKSLFKRLTEPARKSVEIVTKNIDNETGKVKDVKVLANNLMKALSTIAKDKIADLHGLTHPVDIKPILAEFINEVKGVFFAARIPFNTMTIEFPEQKSLGKHLKDWFKVEMEDSFDESEEFKIDETEVVAFFESLQHDFDQLMTATPKKEFKDTLDMFLDDWIEKNGSTGDNLREASIKFIKTMMKTFEDKIIRFGPERLEKLIALTTKKKTPKKEEVKAVLTSIKDHESDEDEDGEKVTTKTGKNQFLKAIRNGDPTITKKHNKDGTVDLIIKGVKL